MMCICGHTEDEHEGWKYKCIQCDCEMFEASTGEAEDYDPREWGRE